MNCLKPLSILNPKWIEGDLSADQWLIVPCGKCPACLIEKRNEWTYRIQSECICYPLNIFFTLTYDELNEPWEETEFGFLPCVVKSDVQKFIKRLRKRIYGSSKSNIRYVVVSEYGPKSLRPHYHGIIFNYPIGRDFVDDIQSCWRFGIIDAQKVVGGAAGYCSKYLFKRVPDECKHMRKCFLLASRRPPLGFPSISKKVQDYLNANRTFFLRTPQGRSVKIPRIFKTKVFDDSFMREISQEYKDESIRKDAVEFRRLVNHYGSTEKAVDAIRESTRGKWSSLLHIINQRSKNSKI